MILMSFLFDSEEILIGLALLSGVAAAGYAVASKARHLRADIAARRIMVSIASFSALLLIAKSFW